MNKYDAIPIRPLTVRGIFGVTWAVTKRGFGAMLVYSLIYVLLIMALLALPLLPLLSTIMPYIGSNWAGNTGIGFNFHVLGNAFSGMLLSVLAMAAINMVILPAYNGTVYGEMSSRIYGQTATLGQLFRKSTHSIKRFFTTSLSYWVSSLIVSACVGIIAWVFIMIGLFSFIPSIINGVMNVSIIVAIILIYIAIVGITMVATTFLSFVYPVAVNEDAKNFKAVGRSIKIAAAKFGRTFGCQLVPVAIIFILALAASLLAMLESEIMKAAGIVGVCVISILVSMLYTPYMAAMQTVLYFDIRTRKEGEDWLGYDGRNGDDTVCGGNITPMDPQYNGENADMYEEADKTTEPLEQNENSKNDDNSLL